MNKRDLAALERVFEAEISGRLPYQSKGKVYRALAADGYLVPMRRTFGGRSVFAVTVDGWELTHAGRIAYCFSCAEPVT